MSLLCKECKSIIDYDSIFCKYCSKKVEPESTLITRDYGNIFNKIHETILKLKTISTDDFNQLYDGFKYYDKRTSNDNDFYRILVDIIFYSGFKASQLINTFIEYIIIFQASKRSVFMMKNK